MKVGLHLPVMVPGLDREKILRWSRRIDEGPFSTLAVGERINFPNPEAMVTLSAAAAVTERVALAFGVLVLPMHRPVLLAKQLATLDVLCGGRLLGRGRRRRPQRGLRGDRCRLRSPAALASRRQRRHDATRVGRRDHGAGDPRARGSRATAGWGPRDHARRAVSAVDPARGALGRRHLGVQLRPDVRGCGREVRARARAPG